MNTIINLKIVSEATKKEVDLTYTIESLEHLILPIGTKVSFHPKWDGLAIFTAFFSVRTQNYAVGLLPCMVSTDAILAGLFNDLIAMGWKILDKTE